jgi:hypothetical protein
MSSLRKTYILDKQITDENIARAKKQYKILIIRITSVEEFLRFAQTMTSDKVSNRIAIYVDYNLTEKEFIHRFETHTLEAVSLIFAERNRCIHFIYNIVQ